MVSRATETAQLPSGNALYALNGTNYRDVKAIFNR